MACALSQAVSELLHRPLYSVSVGELGTNTTELEKSLQEILEVASAWNAVVLLDEADIFLEKRSENDVAVSPCLANVCVCVCARARARTINAMPKPFNSTVEPKPYALNLNP